MKYQLFLLDQYINTSLALEPGSCIYIVDCSAIIMFIQHFNTSRSYNTDRDINLSFLQYRKRETL